MCCICILYVYVDNAENASGHTQGFSLVIKLDSYLVQSFLFMIVSFGFVPLVRTATPLAGSYATPGQFVPGQFPMWTVFPITLAPPTSLPTRKFGIVIVGFYVGGNCPAQAIFLLEGEGKGCAGVGQLS